MSSFFCSVCWATAIPEARQSAANVAARTLNALPISVRPITGCSIESTGILSAYGNYFSLVFNPWDAKTSNFVHLTLME